MKDQKTLKEIYKKDMTNYWKTRRGDTDTKMVDYCTKKAAYIVELPNDNYYVIDKPSIEKDFCFGYGYCGVSTEEDYQGAAGMAAHARTSEQYFIDQNMKQLTEIMEDLKDDRYKILKRRHYLGQQEDCKLIGLDWVHWYDAPETSDNELTPEEIQAILAGYEEVKKQFAKRLNSYLKRYGLTKVNSWAYLVD